VGGEVTCRASSIICIFCIARLRPGAQSWLSKGSSECSSSHMSMPKESAANNQHCVRYVARNRVNSLGMREDRAGHLRHRKRGGLAGSTYTHPPCRSPLPPRWRRTCSATESISNGPQKRR
jgi:hypothetical protein